MQQYRFIFDTPVCETLLPPQYGGGESDFFVPQKEMFFSKKYCPAYLKNSKASLSVVFTRKITICDKKWKWKLVLERFWDYPEYCFRKKTHYYRGSQCFEFHSPRLWIVGRNQKCHHVLIVLVLYESSKLKSWQQEKSKYL